MNKREQVLAEYKVDNGVICSPGKFEGEPVFAPHYWHLGLDGFADSDDGEAFVFKFKNNGPDFALWPELKEWLGCKRTLRLREDCQGFVHCY